MQLSNVDRGDARRPSLVDRAADQIPNELRDVDVTIEAVPSEFSVQGLIQVEGQPDGLAS